MLDLGLQEFKKFSLPEEIAGEKIVARRRTHAHDAELFAMIDRSREHLRRFLFWIDGTGTPDDVRVVTDIFSENWDAQKSFEYVFFDKISGKMVGAGGVHTISHMNRMAEFGYYLDKDACGNGYATEFVLLLERELFSHGIHRCVIECDAENLASAAVAKRLGYTFEGKLRDAKLAYGSYRDGLVFSKLENE
ncbi:MAG: GNAT family N-acetyltransferase [Opitutales bacterium]|nr:GNAT family N-acetyltransferase [Opitutales bacterium]